MSADRAWAGGKPKPAAPSRRQAVLRMLPGGSPNSPRAPFVVLVLLVLGLGLVGLLLLNTSLQQGSFSLRELEAETTQLRDQQTMLADEVAARGAPEELARRARLLGMVPVEEPTFLQLDPGPGEGGTR